MVRVDMAEEYRVYTRAHMPVCTHNLLSGSRTVGSGLLSAVGWWLTRFC